MHQELCVDADLPSVACAHDMSSMPGVSMPAQLSSQAAFAIVTSSLYTSTDVFSGGSAVPIEKRVTSPRVLCSVLVTRVLGRCC